MIPVQNVLGLIIKRRSTPETKLTRNSQEPKWKNRKKYKR